MPSVCACQEAMARRDRVDVITTNPDASPEYNLSLSLEKEIQVNGDECERKRCDGVGDGGAEDMDQESFCLSEAPRRVKVFNRDRSVINADLGQA